MNICGERERELAEITRFSGRTPILVIEGKWAHVATRDDTYRWKIGCAVPNQNRVVLKLEHLTRYCPSGSGYDRVYPFLLRRAEHSGFISPQNTRLIECSVGNAGASFCFAARALGYRRYVVILPADIYPSRIDQVRQLGGQVLFSPPKIGPLGYIELLQRILRRKRHLRGEKCFRLYPVSKIRKVPEEPYALMLGEVSEGLERLGFEDRFDAFAFGIGAGNMISNVGRLMRRKYGTCFQVIAADFAERPFAKRLLAGGKPDIGGEWIDPDYKACTIHGVPLRKLNLDVSVLSEAVSLSRDDRDYALSFVNAGLGLAAGRGTATTFGAVLSHARKVRNKTIFSVVFDSLAKYGTGYYVPLWDLNFDACRGHSRPEPVWGLPGRTSSHEGLANPVTENSEGNLGFRTVPDSQLVSVPKIII